MSWHPAMVRLGKSVQELARETVEEILGFDPMEEESYLPGQSAHKPARPDIQRMQDVYRLHNTAFPRGLEGPNSLEEVETAQKEWEDRYGLKPVGGTSERALLDYYVSEVRNHRGDTQEAFKNLAMLMDGAAHRLDPEKPHDLTPEGKREAGALLKKYEERGYASLYPSIVQALWALERDAPEAYKLFPWAVKQMKANYQEGINFNTQHDDVGNRRYFFTHIQDITAEGGKLLNRLRQENRIPQNLDVNRLSFKEFEEWLMQWKRDNREAESQGEVVYEYDDGWTMQKLTTPEQLQFEGDEMGHCVGGYAHTVGSGQDIIYSLRDPKGMPHVTMEVEALEGAPSYGWDVQGGEEPEDAAYNHEYIHPDQHAPGDHMEESVNRSVDNTTNYSPTGERAFQVVQVQGNGNTTPKPEYQRKVKEFLDYLRSKGWKFERSDNWYAPHDQYDGGGEYEHRVQDARELDDWYDSAYKSEHELYRGANKEDAYGFPAERKTIGVGDWDELFKDIFRSLIYEYDPGKWQGNWRDLAQAVFHAWFIDIYKDHLDSEALEKHRKNLVDEIQNAEQTLHEWVDENWMYAEEHVTDEIADEIKEEAEKRGELEKIEQELEAEYGEDGWTDDNLVEWVRDNDEDLYYHATDKLRDKNTDYFAGDAYKFVNYVIQLAEKFGGVNPQELPDPNERHGGLPSYEELQEMPWKPDPQQQETPVEEGLPGALSAWRAATTWTGCQQAAYETAKRLTSEGQDAKIADGWAIVRGKPQVHAWVVVNGRVIDPMPMEGTTGYDNENVVLYAPEEYAHSGLVTAANEYQIYPIDQEHNVWFDEDGNQHARYRPQWFKNPITEEWLQSADELEDTFLDKQGRQGQGWVAYHGDNPIGSLTYVADPNGWNMLGTTFVHPDYRQQGLFNRMVAPLREEGKPIDAYVWNNPWLKNKVRGWQWN